MAITEKELEISNQSYTNKDFEAIYTELITFAEKLSKRYSPTGSNESDPFIVLLKLAAFVADKVNYNLDKNILERFILSCTQETSMRDITERLGYNMHYYIASATDVIFRYSFESDALDNIYIPRFSILTNGDEIQYVTITPTSIDRYSGESSPVTALQGKIKTLDILGSTSIKLENLNSQNIVYFPERRVAENGIFINVDFGEEWIKSDNLNSEIYGSLVYKFGFDSIQNLPYLEFPEWITDIIGDGLTIQYIVTDGESGNVSARALSTISRSISDEVNDSEIQIYNLSDADTGKNPETLDESYQGFKKVIGTFNTLVTCRDYANKIYQMIDNLTEDPLVSNVQVGDRRNDVNYSCSVVTLGENGDIKLESIPIQETDKKDILNPFALQLYALRPFSNVKTNGYLDSYKLKTKTNDIQVALEENKTICHELDHPLRNDDVGAIEIEQKLSVVINTAKKVNTIEQDEIIRNIRISLANKFNPRNLDFGYEIPFDILSETIKNADERIKSVSLQEPEQKPTFITPAVVKASDDLEKERKVFKLEGIPTQIDDQNSSSQFKLIVVKNVFAGTVSLFEYDDDFNYDYTQKDSKKYTNVELIGTYCNIPEFSMPLDSKQESNLTYNLHSNEAVQFLAPTLATEISYPYGICYNAHILNSSKCIASGSYYKLQGGEFVVFGRKDNNGNIDIDVYSGGNQSDIQLICPNFDLYDTTYYSEVLHPKQDPVYNGLVNPEYPAAYANSKFFMINPKEEVAIKKLSSDTLKILTKCYWLIDFERSKWRVSSGEEVDFSNNKILGTQTDNPNYYTRVGECELILDENDYFFYSDINLTSLFAFGSGTKLVTNGLSANYMKESLEEISVEKVTNEGLRALKPLFQDIPFTSLEPRDIPSQEWTTNAALKIYQNDIVTATENDTVKVEFSNINQFIDSQPDTTAGTLYISGIIKTNFTELEERPDRIQYCLTQAETLTDNMQLTSVNNYYYQELVISGLSTYLFHFTIELDVTDRDAFQQLPFKLAVFIKNNDGVVSLAGYFTLAFNDIQEQYIKNTPDTTWGEFPNINSDTNPASGSIQALTLQYTTANQPAVIKSMQDITGSNITSGTGEVINFNDWQKEAFTGTLDSNGNPTTWIKSKYSSYKLLWAIPNNIFEPIDIRVEDDQNNIVDTDTSDINLSVTIDYADSDESYILGDRSTLNTFYQWQSRALLDLNAGPVQPQTLEGKQQIKIKKIHQDPQDPSFDEVVIEQDSSTELYPTLRFNILTQMSGADNIDLQYTDLNQNKAYPNILVYFNDTGSASGPYATQISDEFYRCNFIQDSSEDPYTCIINCSPIGTNAPLDRYIAVYFGDAHRKDSPLSVNTLITFEPTASAVVKFISPNPDSEDPGTLYQGLTILKVSGNTASIEFTLNLDAADTVEDLYLYLGNLRYCNGINPKLGLTENEMNPDSNDYIIEYMKDKFAAQFNKFYITHDPDNARKIEISDEYKLNSAQAFYDKNNVANKWVIPRIDFENSKITIAHSSKL